MTRFSSDPSPVAADARAFQWLRALQEPATVLGWDLQEWQRVVRLSRRLRLLGRLAAAADEAHVLDRVPEPVRRHLFAELRFARWRVGALDWALERLSATLRERPHPRVLLKGAAYIAQDLPIGKGRLPSDLDILVPRRHIEDVQRRLLHEGWQEAELDEHDRRYYHEWSHEVPPMRHPLHSIELDLHHNILPPVARTRVDADRLLSRLMPAARPGWQVLDPADQILHSASHLFFDSDARDRLRDLVDLDGLMRHFGEQPMFWDGLAERAEELGLQEPLALACRFCVRWLETPVPPPVRRRIEANGLVAWGGALVHRLFEAVLTPTEPDAVASRRQDLAARALLARHHYRRMPLRLLLPHLWHKALREHGGHALGTARPAEGQASHARGTPPFDAG